MKAYVFPGQGSQFPGMGQDLYDRSASARDLFERANDVLGFRLTGMMFGGSEEELKRTDVTQPAIFLHSVVLFSSVEGLRPDMVAGHSLGEFSALVASGALLFEDGLTLVAKRAAAMQKACQRNPSTMAAVLGLDDETVVAVCASVENEVVVAANFNCPGQVVISGSHEGVRRAGEKLKEAGAKRVLPLPVGGAFHSPLMEPARQELAEAIRQTIFRTPACPIYQNTTARAARETADIQTNLINQLTAPVRWTQSVEQMVRDGAGTFVECGPGKVLQGLVKKIAHGAEVEGV